MVSSDIRMYVMVGFIWNEYGLFENMSLPSTTNSTGNINTKLNTRGTCEYEFRAITSITLSLISDF